MAMYMQQKPSTRKQSLPLQEEKTVVKAFLRHNGGCGIDHDNAETGEHHHHGQNYQIVSFQFFQHGLQGCITLHP